MKIQTIIDAWHYTRNLESDFMCTDSVSRKRFERASRQSDYFWNAIDKRINTLEMQVFNLHEFIAPLVRNWDTPEEDEAWAHLGRDGASRRRK